MNFNKIRLICNERKISLKSLSKQIGLTEQGLLRIIRTGKTKLDTYDKICVALGMTSEEFKNYPNTNASIVLESPTEYIVPKKKFQEVNQLLHVGNAIKKQRKELGITKAELAKRLGCTPQNIDSIEGRKSINFEQIFKINKALKFNLFDNYSTNTLELQKEIETLKAMLNDKEKLIKLYEKNLGLKKK